MTVKATMQRSAEARPRVRASAVCLAAALLGACGDLTGPDQTRLEFVWLEFPGVVAEDSVFGVRAIATLSACARVTDVRVERRDTAYVASGLVAEATDPCIAGAVLAVLDTLVEVRASGRGRFSMVSGGLSFGTIEVQVDAPDPAVPPLDRAGGHAIPIRRGSCVLLDNLDGLPVPEYATTGRVAIDETAAASGFVRGTLSAGPVPPGCPPDGPVFQVESLELNF